MPALVWGMLVVLLLAPNQETWRCLGGLQVLFACTVCCYTVIGYLIVPELIAEGRGRPTSRKTIDFILTGLTAGLYMVLAYWLRGGRSLRILVQAQTKKGS